jgi:hypothetical protein
MLHRMVVFSSYSLKNIDFDISHDEADGTGNAGWAPKLRLNTQDEANHGNPEKVSHPRLTTMGIVSRIAADGWNKLPGSALRKRRCWLCLEIPDGQDTFHDPHDPRKHFRRARDDRYA